jgi:hypothetical protein
MTAVLSMVSPGAVPAVTVTSKTTVREPLAGTVMPDTVIWPLLLVPAGGAANVLVAPTGIDTKPPNVVLSGMLSVSETLTACPPADSVSVMV